ncbi:MAG: class I SAM-dependent methyltransferase, partial [Pseudomonadota bacterium]
MSSRTLNLTENLIDYIHQYGLRDTDILAELREETAKLKYSAMQISPEQGAFMSNLIRMLNARRTLEVGVFTGYSALSVALALPAGGEVIACDVSEEWTSIGQRYWEKAGVSDRIKLHLRPATDTLDELIANGEQGQFDFAFIDADKSNYDSYYERALVLIRQGGVIAVDNVLWGGTVADDSRQDDDTRAIRALNEKIAKDERVTVSMLPIGDGLTLA